MSLKDKQDVSYFRLNNELNQKKEGKILLHKDKEALEAYFNETIIPNTLTFPTFEEKVTYLLQENYLDRQMIEKYDFSFIQRLYEQLQSHHFQFQSFMAAYKFYHQYALMTRDNAYYLEDFTERVLWNALFFANGNEKLATALAEEMITQRYQPATPSFASAGKAVRGELVSCFLIQLEDNLNSIARGIHSAIQLGNLGGGVGISLNNLRENGSPIRGIENSANGVVPVMKLFEDAISYSKRLGQRPGAGAVYLNVFHPDIMAFLSTKKENADEKIRVKTLSLGILIPDKFYELCRNNEQMYLFSPCDVEKEYGVPFSYVDITKEYDRLVENPNIRKYTMSARHLEEEISKLQQESGYPYVVNIDTANRNNPIDGTIIMSNLCSEILQVQTPSVINDDESYEVVGADISCNLGSTNIGNLMQSPDFGKSVAAMVRALTFVTDQTHIKGVPTIDKGNSERHTIGLGAMGLHTYLAENEIEYGSKEALDFVDIYFMLLNYWTLKESCQIAKERKETFIHFEKSTYATGEYFAPYLEQDHFPTTEKGAELFAGIFIPTREDWEQLKEEVQTYGLYHQNRLAVAPNGSISYINDTSASLQPITNIIEERQEKKIGKVYYPAPKLSNKTYPYYTSAYDMNMCKVIDTYATAQKHVDQGMSLTLFVRSEIPEGLYPWKKGTKQTTRDLTLLRNYAYKKGIKSIYYVRTYTADKREVGTSTCESCVI